MTNSIRNITIIAHVDHGKTTLIDNLMKQRARLEQMKFVEEREGLWRIRKGKRYNNFS